MKKTVALAALLASIAMPVAAQMAVPLDPQSFRTAAMSSDSFEIQSSRLALERSRNPRVRAFAQQMINDHTMTTQALNGGAPAVAAGGGPAGVRDPMVTGSIGGPAPLDPQKTAMLNQLASLSGPAFDRAYGRAQRMAHEQALAVFTAYAQSGTDPAHVTFARSAIPHLQMHLDMARRLPG